MRGRERRRVAVTRLDALTAAHGLPALCKIDVEGFEAEVLKGLTRPIPALSIEYIPAALEGALAALDRLAALGPYRLNRSAGESMHFAAPDWRSPREMIDELCRLRPADGSGDIYARPAGQPGLESSEFFVYRPAARLQG